MPKSSGKSREQLATETRFVYLLTDPRDNKPLYVGQATCVITRLGQHLSQRPHKNPKLAVILNELKGLLLVPSFVVLERTNGADINERERYWAGEYFKKYPALCNGNLRPRPVKVRPGSLYPIKDKSRLVNSGFLEEQLLTDSNTFND